MRTFDRAVYAIFLLVLMADVACGQSPALEGMEASGGLIVSAPAGFLSTPAVRPFETIRRLPEKGSRPIGSTPATRSLAREFFSSYTAASRQAHAGQVRSIFDLSDFAMGSTATLIPYTDQGEKVESEFTPEASAPEIFEHVGSPAP